MATFIHVVLAILLHLHFTVSSPGYKCPEDSYQHDSSCYSLHLDKLFVYEDSDSFCRAGNGFLSSFQDLSTRDFLRRLRYKHEYIVHWIGFHKVDKKWRYLSTNNKANFTSNLKDSVRKKDKCLVIGQKENFHWLAISCLYKMSYICQYQGEQCENAEQEKKLVFGEKCYKLFHELKKFKDARNSCKRDKGKLVEITDEKEQQFIQNAIKLDNSWTTVTKEQLEKHDRGSFPKIWTGVIYETASNQWISSEGSVHSNSFGVPENGNSQCASSHSWKLSTNPCNDTNGFICEYPVPVNKTIQTVDGLEILLQIYPKLKMQYKDAEDFCEKQGGTLPLLTIKDLKKLQTFNIQLSHTYWVTNATMQSNGFPNTDGKCEAHFIGNELKSRKTSCHSKHNYICQYSEDYCGSKQQGGICFKKHAHQVTFHKAETLCQSSKGKLPEISDMQIYNNLMDFLTVKKMSDFWVKNHLQEDACQTASSSVFRPNSCHKYYNVVCQKTVKFAY